MKPFHIVIDSNVYLSALIFGGNPRKVVEIALQEGVVVLISEELYTEMNRVITRKFPNFITDYKTFESMLRQHTIIVKLGSIAVAASRDQKDNMILETALIGDATIIITGDEDLLVLRKYKNITIVTPAQAVNDHLLGTLNNLTQPNHKTSPSGTQTLNTVVAVH